MVNIKEKFLQTLLIIYIAGNTIAIPYFTWKDILEHNSFVRYIFVSPVVGSFKGFLWPYFGGKSFYQKFYNEQKTVDDNIQNFHKAIAYNILLNTDKRELTKAEKIILTIKIQKEIVKCLEKVNKVELNKMVAGAGSIAVDSYLKASKDLIIGLENKDTKAIASSVEHYKKFQDWMKNNQEDFIGLSVFLDEKKYRDEIIRVWNMHN